MKYNTFFVDLDDTLLDFKASEKLSFTKLFEQIYKPDRIEQIHQSYKKINHKLWQLVEANKMTKDLLKYERFKLTFLEQKIDLNYEDFAKKYLDLLPENVVLIHGAEELCHSIKKKGQLVIITNGIEETQRLRIKNSPLEKFIDILAVSEECGFAKPDVRFFDYTAKKVMGFAKEETIMIGDRLETDIVGAHQFGIDSIWYNPENNINESNVLPTWSFEKLQEISHLLYKL